MATGDIKIGLEVTSNGTIQQETKNTRGLKDMLDDTTASANRASKALSSGRSGTRTGSAGMGQAVTSQEMVAYGRSQAVRGTGSAGRDFAKESEGLGGLVRLYAVYAANLYAAGAAFKALSDAANTENMIKGMDQLGARSGVALGTLAKRFAEASGGALSLRESAEATTKAMSSGLSQKQFVQLGEVAKTASQALGINMSDAVSRLTRGITKLEPELLDELGLFTKIGPATEKYAIELGKPVAALTDFERRQAFANAVLTEGIDKFGKLKLETNPYDKLSASLKNLAQSGLEKVNALLGPIINSLSTNPTALIGAISLLGLNLLKQAIPALGQYREQLQKTAEVSGEIAARRAEDSKTALLAVYKEKAIAKEQAAQTAEEKASIPLTKLEKLRGRKGQLPPGIASIIKEENLHAYTEQQLKDLEKLIAGNKRLAHSYGDLVTQIREAQRAGQEATIAANALKAAEAKKLPFFSTAGINQRIAQQAASTAARSRIISEAVETSTVAGIVPSFAKLGKDTLANKEMGKLNKSLTLVGGSAGILVSGLSRLASSLGQVGMVIGIAVAAFTAIDAMLSKTAEQAQKFDSAVTDSINAVKLYSDTLKIIKEEADPFKTEALMAAKNAVEGLKDSFKGTVKSYIDLQNAIDLSWWDSFKDKVAGVYGGSAAQTFAKTQVAALDTMVAAATRYGNEQELVLKISEALGAPRAQWAKKIAEDGPKAASALAGITPELEKLTNKYGQAAVRSKAFDDSLKEATTKQKQLLSSLTETSPAGQYAATLLNFAGDFQAVIEEGTVGVSRLNDLLSSQKNLGIFSPQVAQGLSQLTGEVSKLNTVSAGLETGIAAAAEKIKELMPEYNKLASAREGSLGGADARRRDALEAEINANKAAISNWRKTQGEIGVEINKLMRDPRIGAAITESFIKSTTYLTREVDLVFAKAALSVKQASLSGLAGQGVSGVAQLQYKFDMEGIALQKEANKSLEEIAKINALSLAIQVQEKAGKLTENLRSGELSAPLAEFKTITEEFGKAVQTGIGSKELMGRIGKAMPGAAPEQALLLKSMFESLLSGRAVQGKKAETRAQETILANRLPIDLLKEETQIRNINLNATLSQNKIEQERIGFLEEQLGYLTDPNIINKQKLANDAAQINYDIKANSIELLRQEQIIRFTQLNQLTRAKVEEIDGLAAAQRKVALGEKDNAIARNGLVSVQDKLKAEQATTQQKLRTLQAEQDIANIYQDIELKALKDGLELDKLRGTLTDQQLQDRESIVRSRETEITYTKELAAIELNYRAKILDLQNRYNAASAATPEGQQIREDIGQQMREEALRQGANIAGITKTRDAQRAVNQEMDNYTVRQKAYGEVFTNTINGMADVLIQFAKTGKLSFSSLISSMIEDLIRFEMKQQSMSFIKGMGGASGLLSTIGSFFGMSGGPVNLGTTTGADMSLFLAKGGAFESGVEKFAKGGAFTNKVVNSPTMFKFAKGTGLMGEAGPEAIMPLKRDGQGNLGVRGGMGGNVEVVVNNYGSEKAETRQTTDNRGNRKIEIVVGDMAAGEMTRSGSSSQRAVGSTFGLKPALIRR